MARKGTEAPAEVQALKALGKLDIVRVPVVPLKGTSSDPERRALDVTDDHAVIDGPADDGDRCGACKGLGLVRGIGKHAGGRYRTLAGAQAAQEAGRAVDCPTCEGAGLVGLVTVGA